MFIKHKLNFHFLQNNKQKPKGIKSFKMIIPLGFSIFKSIIFSKFIYPSQQIYVFLLAKV